MPRVEFTGKDLEEAIASAAASLNLPPEKIKFSLLTMGSKGFFGLGRRKARIGVDPDDPSLDVAEEAAEAPKKNQPQPENRPRPEAAPPASPRPPQGPKGRGERPDQAGGPGPKADKAPPRRDNPPKAERKEQPAEAASADAKPPVEIKPLEWSHVPPPQTSPGPGETELTAPPEDPEGRLAEDLVREIIGRMGLTAQTGRRRIGPRIIIELDSPDNALLIGNRGGTLEALQLLTAKILLRRSQPNETGPPNNLRLVLDVAGYRARRQAQLLENLKNAAEQVRGHGQTQTLSGLNPAERRLLLLALRPFRDLTVLDSGGRDQLLIAPASSSRPLRPHNSKGPRPADKHSDSNEGPADGPTGTRRPRRPRRGGGRKQPS